MEKEKTFIMIKPDGVQRALIGEIISRIEQKGFKLRGLKMMQLSRELAAKHYDEHKERPFFPDLLEFICSGPVVAMVWEGEQVIPAMRTMMGKTNPVDASPGTIRGDLAVSLGQNIIHGSDSLAAAEREISIFFADEEILEWNRNLDKWIF